MKSLGMDVGTYHIVTARRDDKDIVYRKEINAYLTLPANNKFMLNMLRQSKVPMVHPKESNDVYVIGEAAVNLAYSWNDPSKPLRRPMENGVLSVREKDAFNILKTIIHSIIGKTNEDIKLMYCVPADAINTETDAAYHQKIIQSIMDAYLHDGHKMIATPINEALALITAELGHTMRTGVGISFGAGMVNVCYAMYGAPIFEFAVTDSGDWIDRMVAKATGEEPVVCNQHKHDIDLGTAPKDAMERAIKYHYQILIEKTLKSIIQGINDIGAKANPGSPLEIVVAGGTAEPKGFLKLFDEVLKGLDFPLKVGNVKKAEDGLLAVARGCLIAAELDEQSND